MKKTILMLSILFLGGFLTLNAQEASIVEDTSSPHKKIKQSHALVKIKT